jgi:hypothetical protein
MPSTRQQSKVMDFGLSLRTDENFHEAKVNESTY